MLLLLESLASLQKLGHYCEVYVLILPHSNLINLILIALCDSRNIIIPFICVNIFSSVFVSLTAVLKKIYIVVNSILVIILD